VQTVRQISDTANSMTESRLMNYPKYGIYLHAHEQIDFIRSILNSNRLPTDDEKSKIDIGLMAVRELEDEDPEYAKALISLAARFCEL